MRLTYAIAGLAAFLFAGNAFAVGEDEPNLVKNLPASKKSLLDGIAQVTKAGETPTAAKFQFEGGMLKLAVYTSSVGIKTDAEHNVLKEFKGDPKQAEWKPGVEIFEDTPHISRAAEYHTLMEISPFTLADIATKARTEGEMVTWVIPIVSNGKPVFDVGVLKDGKLQHVHFGLLDGKKI